MHSYSLEKAITNAGFTDPDASASGWTDAELTDNMSKIFPDMYKDANNPQFEQKALIDGDPKTLGQAGATSTHNGITGETTVTSKGVI